MPLLGLPLSSTTCLNGRRTTSVWVRETCRGYANRSGFSCGIGVPKGLQNEKRFSRLFSTCSAPSHQVNVLTVESLIPGSGLGRFAWEVSQLGFDTTAVEMSSFMNFAFKFLLSPQATSSLNQHKIYPYAHWFSHQRSNDSLFRAVEFPDVLPRLDGNLRLLQDDFLELPRTRKYDYIVSLFFIDTSSNVFATLEHIHTLLHPDGVWINLGPLLWSFRRCRQVGAKSGRAITRGKRDRFHFFRKTILKPLTANTPATRTP